MASENVHEFTDGNFQSEVLDAEHPVLVDFWAEWCMPCRMLAPTIDEVAQQFEGKVKVGKVNIDEHPDLARSFRVTSIPTIISLKGGEVQDTSVGFRGETPLRKLFETLG